MFKNAEIGKITDAGVLVSDGRIDDYWGANGIAIDKSISDANKTYNNIWTFNSNEALKQFGLKSIEFGNWMNQNDRAFYLYNSTVSLLHLSKIFSIPTQSIGFNGKLSVAFGARGRLRAVAHYERLPSIIINLTKEKGKHSLAHEYGHAIDNLLGYHIKNANSGMITGGKSVRTRVDQKLLDQGNWFEKKFEELFSQLYWNKDGGKSSFLMSLEIENSDYLLARAEVFARTFEVYVAKKLDEAGIENEFLTKKSKFNSSYPSTRIINKVSPIIDNIIKASYQLFSENKNLGAVDVLSQNGDKLDYNGFNPTYSILKDYNHLINGINQANKTRDIYKDGDLQDTIKVIKRVIKGYNKQVSPLAQHLKADTLAQSAFNIFHFIKTNIRYDFDPPGKEQIRTPARTWKDRKVQADCEDYSIFAASLLMQMGYTPTLRIVAFNNKKYFQHIYIVINGVTIDAVLNKFNIEPNFITKVMDVQILSGVSGLGAVNDNTTEKLMNRQTQLIKEYRKTKNPQLKKELRKIRYMILLGGSEERNQMLPIMSEISDISKDGKFTFKKDADLEVIGDYLEQIVKESEEGIQGLSAISNNQKLIDLTKQKAFRLIDEIQALADNGEITQSTANETITDIRAAIDEELNGGMMGFFKKWKKKIKRAVKKATVKVKKAVVKTVKAVKKAATKVGKFIVKFNPLSVLARNAFLLLLRLNFKSMGVKLALGYMTEAAAKKKGVSKRDWINSVNARKKSESTWRKFGGNTGSLRKAALASKKAKRAINGLGVVATATATTVTTATPLLLKILPFLKFVPKVFKVAAFFVKKKSKKEIPTLSEQGVRSQSEADFINNELDNSTKRTEAGSGSSNKTNPIIWYGVAAAVVVGGFIAFKS